MSSLLTNLSFSAAARVLAALGDPGRLRLVALLSRRELCVCHLGRALDRPQPTISRQLATLRAAGLVEARREGSWVHYRVAPALEPATRAVLSTLLEDFDVRRLDAEVSALVKKLGPGACR